MTNSIKPVTAVVVTFQSAKTISMALKGLKECHDEGILDVIIVDNGSSDGTVEIIKKHSYWAKIIITGLNNGFGRGCNAGFNFVESPFTIFVNPDAVVGPMAIRYLLEFISSEKRVGIVGPAIVEGGCNEEKVLQIAGNRVTPIGVCRAITPLLNRKTGVFSIGLGVAPFRVGWVCGAVYMIRTSLMKKLGGFDPRFFLYWEEMDVCKRANDIGFETWAVGRAIVEHVGGASSSPDEARVGGCIAKHYYQSRFYYLTKHHGWVSAFLAETYEFLILCLRALIDLVRYRNIKIIRPRLEARLFSTPEKF